MVAQLDRKKKDFSTFSNISANGDDDDDDDASDGDDSGDADDSVDNDDDVDDDDNKNDWMKTVMMMKKNELFFE